MVNTVRRKRYKKASPERLMAQLANMGAISVVRARAVLFELMKARFGDTAKFGVTLEAAHALRLHATESEIDDWRRQLHDAILHDVGARSAGALIGQGLQLDQVEVGPSADGSLEIAVNGNLIDLLKLQAYLLSRLVGRKRLLRCDCGRIYVRDGKQKSCSTRCTKRVYMRRFRSGEVD